MCDEESLCVAYAQSISYSVWSDRVAAGSFAGELCLCALSSQCHLSNVVSNEKPFRKGKKKEVKDQLPAYQCNQFTQPLIYYFKQIMTNTMQSGINLDLLYCMQSVTHCTVVNWS